MIAALTVMALVVSMTLPGIAQKGPASASRAADEKAIHALLLEYDDARVKRDAAAMGRMLADDFTSITPDGTLNSKEQFIATFTNSRSTLRGIKRDEVSIRFYGDTAVVTSLAALDMQRADGTAVSAPGQRTMMVLVKRQGRWLVVGSQGTAIR